MHASELTISVVICAYTEARWDMLVAAVASVQHQTLPPHEIVVVIDHNQQLFERASRELGVLVVKNQQARGLSGARNSGILAAHGNCIAFMDEDALADPDWLKNLSMGYQDEKVLGVGGAIVPMWPGNRPAWFPEEFDWVVGCTYQGMPTEARPVRNLIGCNMSFRSQVFEAVGGFRQGIGRIGTLPVGCEETELCIRVRQHWQEAVLLYDPAARVQHHVSATRASWKYFFSRCYAEGLSKALVSRLVGASDGLSSERKYTFYTLPKGVLDGLGDTVLRRKPGGIASSVAIVSGLLVTTFGYLRGLLARNRSTAQMNLEVGMVKHS